MVSAKWRSLARRNRVCLFGVSAALALSMSITDVAVAQDPVGNEEAVDSVEAERVPAKAAKRLPGMNKIMANYFLATGSAGFRDALRNRLAKGTFRIVEMDVEATFETYIAPPGKSYTKVEFGSLDTIESGVRKNVVWELSELKGPRLIEGDEKVDRLLAVDLDYIANWKKHFRRAETVGMEFVGNSQCYKVVMTRSKGSPMTCYFDKDSGYVLKTEVQRGKTVVETRFGRFKRVDGIRIPHKIVVSDGKHTIETTVESVEHNVDIPASLFRLPDAVKELVEKTK